MKKYVLLGYYLVCSTMLLCQTLTIIHKDSAMPIIGATLLSSSPQVTAVTNANGQVDISAFAKSDKIEIRSLGFQSIIASYTELQRLDYKLQMEPANFNLENVVVSATRWRQSSAKVPSKIISIRPEEIALQNPQTAADLLGNSGKVFIQKSQQGGGSPMIRGFATNRLIYV
ncbi:MAG: TonB-dependent receptor, partial [Saprospiraceae bacterium]|nr:TonB-dependent receptor [Saprospiraceae bacterium]